MIDRRELAGHLRLFAEWGVGGVSRDPKWRARAGDGGLSTSGAQSQEPSAERQAPSAENLASCSTLAALRDHIGPCTRCKLHRMGRRQVVFGVGNPNAALMFVGEAPGADEDLKGEPFVGAAGQLLTKIIGAIGLARADVYIANVIKCRPPGNRNPEPDEVATCQPFLDAQIDLVRPRVIVALGSFAAHALLKTDAPISRLRGRVHDYRGGAKLIPTFHPAFLLRTPERKRDVWEDMKKVRALLAEGD
jgi:uracil-DNA glycosylase family 4